MARAYADEMDQEQSQQALAQVCFFKYIVLICRIFGFITFISLMSVGIHTIVVFAQEPKTENGGPRNLDVGIYIVCAGILVFILESSWLFFRLLKCCQKNCCHYVFVVILWIDVYKRGLVYFLMALPCFLQGIQLPLGLLCGFLLCVAALLYIAKTYQRFGEEYALSQLTGKNVTTPPSDEYTKLLQTTVNSVATQTSADQSEEEELEDEEAAAAEAQSSVSSAPPRPSAPPATSTSGGNSGAGSESPFATLKNIGKKKKPKKEEKEKPMEVTLETDLEGSNPFAEYGESFD